MMSDDSDVRKLVVDTLAGIGDERSIPELIARRGDPDPNVRAAIADALGAIGGEAAATALSEIAVSVGEDQLVRFSALHAMAAIEAPVMARDLGPVELFAGNKGLSISDLDALEEAVTVKIAGAASAKRDGAGYLVPMGPSFSPRMVISSRGYRGRSGHWALALTPWPATGRATFSSDCSRPAVRPRTGSSPLTRRRSRARLEKKP